MARFSGDDDATRICSEEVPCVPVNAKAVSFKFCSCVRTLFRFGSLLDLTSMDQQAMVQVLMQNLAAMVQMQAMSSHNEFQYFSNNKLTFQKVFKFMLGKHTFKA